MYGLNSLEDLATTFTRGVDIPADMGFRARELTTLYKMRTWLERLETDADRQSERDLKKIDATRNRVDLPAQLRLFSLDDLSPILRPSYELIQELFLKKKELYNVETAVPRVELKLPPWTPRIIYLN